MISVHTPEFSFEHDIEGFRRATMERAIGLSGRVDNDYAIWSAFENHYWPPLYFIDGEGVIRDQHVGEERYEGSERSIQRMLGLERGFVPFEGAGVEARADWPQLATPESYLGYARGERLSTMGEPALEESRDYELPEHLRVNQWALAGEWIIARESVALQRPGGSTTFHVHARDGHIVLSPERRDPIPFRVLSTARCREPHTVSTSTRREAVGSATVGCTTRAPARCIRE